MNKSSARKPVTARRVLMAAVSSLLLSAGSLLSPTSASALADLEIDYANMDEMQDTYLCDAKVGNTYAMGCFNNNGDVLYVADWQNDSMRVAVHWRLTDGSRRGLCISTTGPVWIPSQGWVGVRRACDKDMVEGKTIEIRAGRCDGTIHSCERIDDYQDWTAWEATTV